MEKDYDCFYGPTCLEIISTRQLLKDEERQNRKEKIKEELMKIIGRQNQKIIYGIMSNPFGQGFLEDYISKHFTNWIDIMNSNTSISPFNKELISKFCSEFKIKNLLEKDNNDYMFYLTISILYSVYSVPVELNEVESRHKLLQIFNICMNLLMKSM
jgi:hypothetical protein